MAGFYDKEKTKKAIARIDAEFGPDAYGGSNYLKKKKQKKDSPVTTLPIISTRNKPTYDFSKTPEENRRTAQLYNPLLRTLPVIRTTSRNRTTQRRALPINNDWEDERGIVDTALSRTNSGRMSGASNTWTKGQNSYSSGKEQAEDRARYINQTINTIHNDMGQGEYGSAGSDTWNAALKRMEQLRTAKDRIMPGEPGYYEQLKREQEERTQREIEQKEEEQRRLHFKLQSNDTYYDENGNPLSQDDRNERYWYLSRQGEQIKDDIQELSRWNPDTELATYQDIFSRPDFMEKVRIGEGMESVLKQDDQIHREAQNRLNQMRLQDETARSTLKTEEDMLYRMYNANPLYQYMTQDEKNIYYYLLGSGDQTSAEDYLGSLEGTLSIRQGAELAQSVENTENPALRNVRRSWTSLGSGLTGTLSGLETIGRRMFFNDQSPSNPTGAQVAYSMIRPNVSTGAGIAMDVSQGVGGMVPAIAASTATGNPAVGAAVMGAGSAGQTYSQSRQDGASDSQALMYGVMNGLSESLLQYGIGGISSLGKGVAKNAAAKSAGAKLGKVTERLAKNQKVIQALDKAKPVIRYAGKMGDEAMEEYLQAVIDPVLRNSILNENNEISPFSEDKLYSALLGAITAGVVNIPSARSIVAEDSDFWYNINKGGASDGTREQGQETITDNGNGAISREQIRAENSASANTAIQPVSDQSGNYANAVGRNAQTGAFGISPAGQIPSQVPGRSEIGRTGTDQGVAGGVQYDRPGNPSRTLRLDLISPQTRKVLDASGAPNIDLQSSTDNPAAFSSALSDAIQTNERGAYVSPHTPEELTNSGAKTYLSQDGMAGVAVWPDGNIGAVFNNEKSSRRGAASELLITALSNGGNKLDNFDGGLNKIYARYGFVPVAKTQFDPEFAPDGWKSEFGQPDIIFWVHNGDPPETVATNIGKYPSVDTSKLPIFPDYDSAYSYRDSLIETKRRDANTDSSGGGENTSDQMARETSIETSPYGRNTVGAAERNPDSYSALQGRYGTIEPGENPIRMVDVPKRSAKGRKTRRNVRTQMEAEAIPDEMIPEYEQAVAKDVFGYDSISNRSALEKAKTTLRYSGYEEALKKWEAVASGRKKAGKDDIALGQLLLNNAANAGDTELTMKLAAELAAEATRAGQTTQAFSMLKRMTPEGQAYYLQKSVQKVQDDLIDQYGEQAPKLSIPDEMIQKLLDAKNQEEINAAQKDIYEHIGKQIPATFMDKWNAWRYFSMLFNPKTHIKNLSGNLVFMPMRKLKNLIKAGIEKVSRLPEGKRTATILTSKDKALKQMARDDFKAVQNSVMGSGKYNPSNLINEGRIIYKNKPMEKLRKFNTWLLDQEDMIFSRIAYVDSFAQYMKANHFTPEYFKSNTEQAQIDLQKCRSYAFREAQKATYRDDNALASALSKISRINRSDALPVKAGKFVLEGVLPFKKTPMNIVKRGIEYSPISIVNGLYDAIFKVRRGDLDASEAIDKVASGLSGSAVMALGAWLAAQGFLSGVSGGDKEDEFERMQGKQEYALNILGHTYTLDWMAPPSLPLFVGAELYNAMEKESEEGYNLTKFFDQLTKISEPMLDMTMLQGLNSAIRSVQYGDAPIYGVVSSALSNYATQALPSVLNSIGKTIDATRRTTYAPKDSPATKSGETFGRKVASRFPGASMALEPYVDSWGREETTANIPRRIFENFLSPGYLEKVNETDVDKEISRVYQQTSENSVFPRRAPTYKDKEDKKYYLDSEELTQYQKTMGQTSYRILQDIFKDDAYSGLSDEDKAELIGTVYSYASDKAKVEFFDGRGISAAPTSLTDKVDKAKEEGIPEETTLLAYQLQKDVESDKDEDGETIPLSASRNKVKALGQITAKLSDDQTYLLYEMFQVSEKVWNDEKRTKKKRSRW